MRKSNSATRTLTAYVMHIPTTLSLTSEKKQPQAKIAIEFLFGQLHFNDVTSHALFYGGYLVMRSKRCAVQNLGITLSLIAKTSVEESFRQSNYLEDFTLMRVMDS